MYIVDDRLTDLLGEVVASAENHILSDKESGEKTLLSWQTDYASYRLVQKIIKQGKTVGGLSQREQQIIRLIMQGMCNKSIARILDISPNTVSTYIRRVFTKLEVCTRAEMVSRVLRDNLLENEADLH